MNTNNKEPPIKKLKEEVKQLSLYDLLLDSAKEQEPKPIDKPQKQEPPYVFYIPRDVKI